MRHHGDRMNSFRGRISRSKIVRLKVLVQMSECLTEEINNLIDDEQFRPRRLWVRKWIRRRETNLTVSSSDHLVFCISKYTQKTKTVTVKTRHVSTLTLSTLSFVFTVE